MVLDKRVAVMEQDDEMAEAIFFQKPPAREEAAVALQEKPSPSGNAESSGRDARGGGGGGFGLFGAEDQFDTSRQGSRRTSMQSGATGRRESVSRDIADKTGVPIDTVIKHLKNKTQGMLLSRDFTMYVPFLVLFCLFSQRDIVEEHYANRIVKDLVMGNPIPNEADKYYLDMQNAADWGLWISNVGIPNIWGPKGCGGERFDEPNTFPYLQTKINHVIGAVRIRTQRVTNDSCSRNDAVYRTQSSLSESLLKQLDAETCYGEWRGDDHSDRHTRFNIPNPLHYPHLYFVNEVAPLVYDMDWPTRLNESWWKAGEKDLDAHFAKPQIRDFVFYRDGIRQRQLQAPEPTVLEDPQRWNYTFTFDPTAEEPLLFDEYTIRFNKMQTNLRLPTEWTLYVNDIPRPLDFVEEVGPETVKVYTTQNQVEPFRKIPDGGGAAMFDTTQQRVVKLTFIVRKLARHVVNETDETPFLWNHQTCNLAGFAGTIIGDFDAYNCGGYWIDIPFNASCRLATDISKIMMSNNAPFHDNYATRLLTTEFFFFNTYLDSFISSKLYSEESAGGVWRIKHQIRSFDLYTNEAPVVESLLLVLVLYFIYAFIRDWRNYYRGRPPGSRQTKGRIAGFMMEFWNILEFVNLMCLLMVYVTWFIWIAESNSMKFKLPYEEPGYPEELDWPLNIEIFNRYTNAINMIAVFMKFLKFVRLNSRLNVLSETISLKSADLMACLIVFFFIVFAFALTGMSLFGPAMFEYRSLGFAYEANMRVLVGDYDYTALKQENLILTALYFWSYLVIALFLLLNFLIAILSEGFATVHSDNFVLPLDEQLTVYWVGLKRALAPKRLFTGIKMMLTGRSRYVLLVDAMCKIEAHRDVLEETLEDANDMPKIYLTELPAFIGDEYELLGEDYIGELWADIVFDFSHDQDYARQRETSSQRSIVEQAATKEASGSFYEVQNAWHKLLVLQDSLDTLLNLLSQDQGGWDDED